MKILGFVGSLRRGSYNRMVYNEFAKRLPAGAVEEGHFGDWPLYNKDTEDAGTPQAVLDLKQKIAAADGVFFVTPEYNRSIPGGLKNMLDWTSRGDALVWEGKKAYVMGVSNGDRGAIVSQYDLKRVLTYFGCQLMGRPEFYLNSTGKFDEAGTLTDAKTTEVLDRAAAAFAAFITQ